MTCDVHNCSAEVMHPSVAIFMESGDIESKNLCSYHMKLRDAAMQTAAIEFDMGLGWKPRTK